MIVKFIWVSIQTEQFGTAVPVPHWFTGSWISHWTVHCIWKSTFIGLGRTYEEEFRWACYIYLLFIFLQAQGTTLLDRLLRVFGLQVMSVCNWGYESNVYSKWLSSGGKLEHCLYSVISSSDRFHVNYQWMTCHWCMTTCSRSAAQVSYQIAT